MIDILLAVVVSLAVGETMSWLTWPRIEREPDRLHGFGPMKDG